MVSAFYSRQGPSPQRRWARLNTRVIHADTWMPYSIVLAFRKRFPELPELRKAVMISGDAFALAVMHLLQAEVRTKQGQS